jgi:hypothetical protein
MGAWGRRLSVVAAAAGLVAAGLSGLVSSPALRSAGPGGGGWLVSVAGAAPGGLAGGVD